MADERNGMTPDPSTGARLRALIEKLIPWLTHSDGCGALVPPYSYCSCGLNYAYHSALAAVAELDALLLVSESHQSEHIDADDLRAAGNACDAQGNIHDRQQLEEGHAGPPWRGREWHELAQKFIKASDHGQLVTESHPSDRLRALMQELVDRYTKRQPVSERHGGCGWCGGLPHSVECLVGRAEALLLLVRASQPSEGWQEGRKP